MPCGCGDKSADDLRNLVYTAEAYLRARVTAGNPCDPGPMIPCTADAEECCLQARLTQLECIIAANGNAAACTACNINYKVDVDACEGIEP